MVRSSAPACPAAPLKVRQENPWSDPCASLGYFTLPDQLTSGPHVPFSPAPARSPGFPRHVTSSAPARPRVLRRPPTLTVPAAPPRRRGASSRAWTAAVVPRSEALAAGSTRAADSAGASGGPQPSRAPGPAWSGRGAARGVGAGRAARRSNGRRSRGEHAQLPAARRRSRARRACRSAPPGERLRWLQPRPPDARRLPGSGSFRAAFRPRSPAAVFP